MTDRDERTRKPENDAGRRALLKAATVAGGAAAAAALLPGSWRKPVATLGGLPAHAQTSQAITLTGPEAFFVEPNGVGRSGLIEVRCGYEDALGEFDATHRLTYSVAAGVLSVAAVGNGVCGNPVTVPLGELQHVITGDGFAGQLTFVVSTACFPPGRITWNVHKGGGHASNVVSAVIGLRNGT